MLSDGDDPNLRQELEISLERNLFLEKENEQLKEELAQLKAKLRHIKLQNIGKQSVLRKKLMTVNMAMAQAQQNQILEVSVSDEHPDPKPAGKMEKTGVVPKPPPRPMTCLPGEGNDGKVKTPPVPAPASAPAPPPPPPPPSKLFAGSANVVRRVPGVMEFYHSLTRKDARIDGKTSLAGVQLAANAKNMIGEIENRSRYLMAIKSDVETQGELIRFLTKEVLNAAFKEISEVEAFVKWLDRQLSYLVDERAVLKHFPEWPEQKADAMREAAFSYRDLFNLESEISSFKDDPKEALCPSLKRIQALQDRLERSVHNIQRTRDSVSKRYRGFQIPCEWMLETGMISQLKLCSMKLAKEYMKRITYELRNKELSQKEDLVLQGARFAFRVHQFAGGFNKEAMVAFEELKKADTGHNGQENNTSIPKNILRDPNRW